MSAARRRPRSPQRATDSATDDERGFQVDEIVKRLERLQREASELLKLTRRAARKTPRKHSHK